MSTVPELNTSPQLPGWWDELAVSALLGTDRRPQIEIASIPGELGTAIARLGGDPAAVLLDAAALGVAYRRGGVPVAMVAEVPDRAPGEPAPRPTPRAGAQLGHVLQLPAHPLPTSLLRFWCETAAAAGLVAPDAYLPALLDQAVRTPALRAAIVAVLGERGRWLAAMQPRWAVLLADVESPAAGPPEAGYAERMRGRALKFVRRERSGFRTRMIIEVPDQLDPEATGDGVTNVQPNGPDRAGARDRSWSRADWWLVQVVAATPLPAWAEVFDSPQQALKMSSQQRPQPPIWAGWATAAFRERNPQWALALLQAGSRYRFAQLLPLLDEEQQALVVREMLLVFGTGAPEPVLDHLSGPGPWPEPVAAIVLRWLLHRITRSPFREGLNRPLAELISIRFPFADGGAAVAAAADSIADDRWRYRLHSVAENIAYRNEIHKELQ